MFKKNPQWIGFATASLIGLASLVVYQNCGLPDPKMSNGSSSTASSDFYRWMPDTLVSFSCDNINSPDSFPRFWAFGVTNLQSPSSGRPQPSGIYLSDYGKGVVKNLSASAIANLLPRQDIALVGLNWQTFAGRSSADWQPAFSTTQFYTKSIGRSNKALNVKSSAGRIPASDFAASMPAPFGANTSPSQLYGGGVVYSNTWMKSFFDPSNTGALNSNCSGGSPSCYKQYALGLLFSDPNSFDYINPQFISSVDSRGYAIKSGSAITTTSNYYGHILWQVNQYSNSGGFDIAGSTGYTWKCGWPSDGGNPSTAQTQSVERMFMVFKWPDFITQAGNTAGNIYCDASGPQTTTAFPRVPAELFNTYYFGKMAGPSVQPVGTLPAYNCVVKKTNSASDQCYSASITPDYAVTNFTAAPNPSAAAAWMSICTRE